jgi:hypothetical protein
VRPLVPPPGRVRPGDRDEDAVAALLDAIEMEGVIARRATRCDG